MAARPPENADRRPTEELDGELRQAVENVLSQPPPEDLMRHTLDGLRRPSPRVARATTGRIARLAVLAAAATITVCVWLGGNHHGANGPNGSSPPRPVAEQAMDRLPTLWAYHRASLDSPEALDKLLQKHAAHLLVVESEPVRMGASLGPGHEPL